MLTPVEVNNKEFSRKFRGYDVDEVDEFLDVLTKDYERLYKDNAIYKERAELDVEFPPSNPNKEMEETLKQTLIMAQMAAEDAKRNAQEKAQLIVAEAEAEAARVTALANEKIRIAQERLDELVMLQNSFVAKMKGLLSTYVDILKATENDIRYK